jgi:hypothetical protein
VYTKYSIHQLQHTPTTAYTEYCIHCVLNHLLIHSLPLPASPSSLGGPCCAQFSTFPQLHVNQCIHSQLLSHLPPEPPPLGWPPPHTPPISLDPGLLVYLTNYIITASKCISMLVRSYPSSSHDHWLQNCSVTATEYITQFTQSLYGEMVQLVGWQPIINILLHLACYRKRIFEKARFWLAEH